MTEGELKDIEVKLKEVNESLKNDIGLLKGIYTASASSKDSELLKLLETHNFSALVKDTTEVAETTNPNFDEMDKLMDRFWSLENSVKSLAEEKGIPCHPTDLTLGEPGSLEQLYSLIVSICLSFATALRYKQLAEAYIADLGRD